MTYSAETYFTTFKLASAVDLRTAVTARLARIAYRYRVRRTTRILSALSEMTLHDIGLDRDQIAWAARHAAKVAEHRIAR
ncbi:MAG: DUF1127 domain-containing protein [Kiloniellaceae bacterium]